MKSFHRYCLHGAEPICLLTSLFLYDLISVLPNFSTFGWVVVLDFLIMNEVFPCQLSVLLLCPFSIGLDYWSFHYPFVETFYKLGGLALCL